MNYEKIEKQIVNKRGSLKKRSLALFMAVVMLLGLQPMPTFALESDEQRVNPSVSHSFLSVPEEITVLVGIYDYTAVTYGSDKASQDGIVLNETEVTVPADSTALGAIEAALVSKNILYTINSSYNYISSVNGLSEYDCGSNSGWMFSINDNFGNMGASATTISDGDKLELHYSVTGFGNDVGSYWSGGPTITKLSLGGKDTVISSHTTYADANDYTGTTTYYLGQYTDGGNNVPLVGMGTLASPYAIPIEVSANTDITSLTAVVESTLHPHYLSFATDSGLVDVTKTTDYSTPATFCLQTVGGYYKTYYTIQMTKAVPSGNMATISFDSNGGTVVDPISAEVGSAISAPQSPTRTGYTFVGWYTREAIATNRASYVWDTMPAKGFTLVAKWIENGGGTGSSDIYSADRTRAQASLLVAYQKCSQADYTSANWALVQAAYDAGVTNIQNAATYDAIYAALNDAIESIANINVKSNSRITICVAVEKFTLGQGYIIEPTLVKIPDYTQASVVLTDLLSNKFPKIAQPYKMTGSVESGFYLSYIYDTDTDVNVPSYILNSLGGSLVSRVDDSLLGEFDYSNQSGWMYSVKDSFPIVGASDWRMSDGEVVRWQFSLSGYGADLDADNNAWAQSSLKSLADKDALTWRVAEINGMSNKAAVLAAGTNQKKYNNAIEILKQMDSTQKEVNGALSALNNLTSVSSGSNSSGKGTTTHLPAVQPTEVKEDVQNSAISFSDVEDGNWAKSYIHYLVDKGVIKGKTETTFAPDDYITRAEFVAILSRIASDTVTETESGFEDVKASDWFSGNVSWAVKAGVAKGVSETEFSPNANISRQDMAVMIANFAKYMNKTLPENATKILFADDLDISDYAKQSVGMMQMAGIINGKGENHFMPNDHATRAEAATLLAKLIQLQ